jgi:membrane-associated phospholipid phosphatase
MIKAIALAVTDCGDLAVLLPIAALLAAALWRFESRAAAWAWLQALAFCLVATFVLKIGFLTCGRAWGLDILSPSGHASMSTAVYGALALVIATQTTYWRPLIVLSGALFVGAIAITRIALQFHSKTEVAVGLAVGLASLCVFAWKYRRLTHPKINLPAIGVGAACVFALLYGARLPGESLLYELAHTVHAQTRVCGPDAATEPVRTAIEISR